MKEIDEELVAQIKTVFENFDDEASENGWAKLREKYPEKESKKLPIWWLSGIAAAILVALGLFLMLDNSAQKIDNGQQVAKQQPVIIPKTNGMNSKEIIIKKDQGTITNQPPLSEPTNSKKIENPIITTVKKERLIGKVEQTIKPETVVHQNPVMAINQNATVANKVDTTQKTINQKQVIANNPTAVKEPSYVKKTTEDFLNEQSKILAQKPKEQTKTKETKSSIEVFSGTFLNYYADNAAKLNAGFGVNANVKLTKSLFVSFGAGISQNKINYQKSIPVEVSQSFSSFSGAYDAPNSSGNTKSSTTISDISINAQLLNFDIPISLKFYPTKKQNFYIAAGINSNTYLSQKYTYDYNLSNVNVLGITQTAKQEESEKSKKNGFDFATSAIFAIGINQNIGRNSLTFEPYFKPAIGNMGEKNLRINTVGLNLKFNFTPDNKK